MNHRYGLTELLARLFCRVRITGIAAILVVVPFADSLAKVHKVGIPGDQHDLHSAVSHDRATIPCHQVNTSHPAAHYLGATTAETCPATAKTDYPTTLANLIEHPDRASTARNEQWCSDPSIHLVNCVFRN